MFYKGILLIFLFTIISTKAFSAVFVVTSNADSGPGTLREALILAAANGSATQDIIQFNLLDLSVAGRTISLISQLPDVSSNLVIDGTTQPGVKFGVSDAKVALFYSTSVNQKLSGLNIVSQTNVTILGLYIKFLTDITQVQTLYFWTGIDIEGSSNISIGAAGKGNVILGFYFPIATNFIPVYQRCNNITIKDNFCDVDVDGISLSPNLKFNQGTYLLYLSGLINIGGLTKEGNLFASGLYIYQSNDDEMEPLNTFYIENNKVGVNYDVTQSLIQAHSSGIIVESKNGGNEIVNIEDNVISNGGGFGAVFLSNILQEATLLRNYIGIDKTKTHQLTVMGPGIEFFNCFGKIQIGGNNPTDANVIAYCKPLSLTETLQASFNKNSMFCTHDLYPIYSTSYYSPITTCNITKINNTSVSGTSTPNATVELFYSDICKTCSPQTYFASVVADNNGNWTYTGSILGAVIASATVNGSTSEFTKASINLDNIQIINSCGGGTGSIKGVIPQSAADVKWLDENGNVVGTNPDLLNVKLGKYKLVAQNGDCVASTPYFEIKNKFQLDITSIVKTNPSCGNSVGAISGLNIINNDAGAPVTTWQDINGKVLGNSLSLTNVSAGEYYLVITGADAACTQKYGPFTLKNISGPNIDQSKINIQSTNCGQSTGSITNLQVTGTGTLKYTWTNGRQQQVGIGKDLINQPAGTYKLQVTDDSQCGSIFTTDIVIPETNGIILDESKVQTRVASCSKNNGSVTGIQVTGNAQYKWVDANGNVVSTTPDLQNAASGDYTFTAYNSFGCSQTSKTYHIGLQPPTQFPVYASTVLSSCYDSPSGSISVTIDGLVQTVRWVNSDGQTVGSNNPVILDVYAGTYQLYLTDQNGCENYYNSYTVQRLPEFKIADIGQITNDQCGLKIGSISGEVIQGGYPPYTYQWTNANGNQIGSGSSISNLGAGTYSLNVTDVRCGNRIVYYNITDQFENIAAPSVSDVQLCSSGDAIISVNNASPTITYRLYSSQGSATPVDQQVGGKFKVSVAQNQSFYISQLNGICESARSEVKITVGISAVNIANAFTPNGDGINDYWKIAGLENYTASTVQVFTRYGQKVFESRGYAKPFDGTLNGKNLPNGVYYYIINLSANCSVLSGSLTIIR